MPGTATDFGSQAAKPSPRRTDCLSERRIAVDALFAQFLRAGLAKGRLRASGSGSQEANSLSTAESHSEPSRDSPQSSVAGPQAVGLPDSRPEKMRVDEPDSSAVEPPVFDERENLVVIGLPRPRQGMEELNDHATAGKGAAGQFTDHKWMTHDLARL